MKKKKLAAQFLKFDGYKSLDFQNKVYQEKAFKLFRELDLKKPRFVELGCADGGFAQFLAEKCDAIAYGMDITPMSIEQAKNKGVRATLGDLSKKFKFESSFFDAVIALETIEHIFDTDLFLEEIERILKNGGYCILSTPNLASIQNRIRLFFNKYPRYLSHEAGDGHIFLYTLPELIKQMEKHGLVVVKSTSPNFFNPFITKRWMPRFGRKIFMYLGDVFPTLGSHLIVLAKKA